MNINKMKNFNNIKKCIIWILNSNVLIYSNKLVNFIFFLLYLIFLKNVVVIMYMDLCWSVRFFFFENINKMFLYVL